MLDGWREYRRLGITQTEEIQALKADLMERANSVGGLIADPCDLAPSAKIKVAGAYNAHVQWCDRTGATEYRKSGFANLVHEKRHRKKKTDGGNWFYTWLRWRSYEGVRDLLAASNIIADWSANDTPADGAPADDKPPPF